MTFLDLYGNFLDQELGSADRVTLFTVPRRKLAINNAQLWFTQQTACLEGTARVPLVAGVDLYPLEALLTQGPFLAMAPTAPELWLTNAVGASRQIAGIDEFPRRTEQWLNNTQPGWRTSPPGTPECWYESQEGAAILFGLAPPPLVPIGETWEALVPYIMKPDPLVTDTDVPFTILSTVKTAMEPWHRALAFYAAHDLEKLRKDNVRSAAALGQAQAEVQDYLGSRHVPQSAVIQSMRIYRRSPGEDTHAGARFGRSSW